MAFEKDPEGAAIAIGYAGPDFDKPRIVQHEPLREYADEEWSVDDFVKLITDTVAEIPPECRASAKVSLYDPGYDGSTSLRLSYTGPESAEEVARRVQNCVQYVAGRRASERATFERLKKKFES